MALPRPETQVEGGGSSSKLPLRVVVGTVVTRLLIMPVIGLAIIGTAVKLGAIPEEDRLLILFLLMQASVPLVLHHASPSRHDVMPSCVRVECYAFRDVPRHHLSDTRTPSVRPSDGPTAVRAQHGGRATLHLLRHGFPRLG